MPGSDTQTLVSQLRKKDPFAFERIYKYYWQSLYDMAYKRLGNREQTEDLIQNVFVRLWANAETQQIENLNAYLYASVRYEVIRLLTRQKTHLQFSKALEDILQEQNLPDAGILTKELMAIVQAFASTLPEKRRRIFLLHVEKRWSTSDISEELGVSQKTVQNQLRTAMKDFKKSFPILLIALLGSYF